MNKSLTVAVLTGTMLSVGSPALAATHKPFRHFPAACAQTVRTTVYNRAAAHGGYQSRTQTVTTVDCPGTQHDSVTVVVSPWSPVQYD